VTTDHLTPHTITLRGERLTLRPLTEADWDTLLRWNNDPEVLYYAEGEDVEGYTLEEVQELYRTISRLAFCFMMEYDGRHIGECWLQRMNLARILEQYPGQDVRRIDLLIGEKSLWGRGLGTEAIRLLVTFAFAHENADAAFACDVADYNQGSLRAFEKAGFAICATHAQPPGQKARFKHDLILRRPVTVE
jgi:RimJ/RimL family protein N-acetyltransferase